MQKCQHVCRDGPAKGSVCAQKLGHLGPHMDPGRTIPGTLKGIAYKTWDDTWEPFVPDPEDEELCRPPKLTLKEALALIEEDRRRVEDMRKQRKK